MLKSIVISLFVVSFAFADSGMLFFPLGQRRVLNDIAELMAQATKGSKKSDPTRNGSSTSVPAKSSGGSSSVPRGGAGQQGLPPGGSNGGDDGDDDDGRGRKKSRVDNCVAASAGLQELIARLQQILANLNDPETLATLDLRALMVEVREIERRFDEIWNTMWMPVFLRGDALDVMRGLVAQIRTQLARSAVATAETPVRSSTFGLDAAMSPQQRMSGRLEEVAGRGSNSRVLGDAFLEQVQALAQEMRNANDATMRRLQDQVDGLANRLEHVTSQTIEDLLTEIATIRGALQGGALPMATQPTGSVAGVTQLLPSASQPGQQQVLSSEDDDDDEKKKKSRGPSRKRHR